MRKIILCDKPGRLGNLLIVFTHFAALALERKFQIINPSFSPYKHYLESTLTQSVPCFNTHRALSNVNLRYKYANLSFRILRKSAVKVPLLFQVISLDWNESLDLDQLANQDRFDCEVNLVGGWLFRCESLVAKYKPQLSRFFLPLNRYIEEARIHIIKARHINPSASLIGIHIRHGDYKLFQGGKFYYSLSFYRSLIKSLYDHHSSSLVFIVVSDQSLSYNDFDDPNIYLSNSAEIVDMIILSMCDGVIGPPSTFSQYASCFWGNGNLFHLQHDEFQVPQSFFDSLSTN